MRSQPDQLHVFCPAATLRWWTRFSRWGTLIRYAFSVAAATVPLLTVAMIQPPLEALLMTPVGRMPLPENNFSVNRHRHAQAAFDPTAFSQNHLTTSRRQDDDRPTITPAAQMISTYLYPPQTANGRISTFSDDRRQYSRTHC